MNKLDTIRGPSCLTRAEDDEEVFVLRANDPLAPMVVERWAAYYLNEKMSAVRGITPEQLRKHAEALECAQRMRAWRVEHRLLPLINK